MKSINRLIESDLYRYTGEKKTFTNFCRTFILVPGFRYTYFLRKASKFSKKDPRRWFYWVVLRRIGMKFGFQISDRTSIEEGFYIGHFGSIVITHNAIIGSNCNINVGVVIGQTSRGNKKGPPVIGNSVWIGSNSIVVGKIKVGSNVLVAPGAFVNFDVPDNSIVIGNPGKIIKKDDATKSYIKRILK
tara:strand:- start:7573 stop:8136 length:564 start_codon:yes stop_codon:yes gene_type:complete